MGWRAISVPGRRGWVTHGRRIPELAFRIAESFRSPMRAFVFQRWELHPSQVMDVLREVRADHLVQLQRLRDGSTFVLLINTRGCINECRYRVCRQDDRECLEGCVRECVERRRSALLERLSGRSEEAWHPGQPPA